MISYYWSKYAGDIPFLTDTNYNIWKNAIIIHLQAIRAYDHVIGLATPPSSSLDISAAGEPCTIGSSQEVQQARDSFHQQEAKAKGVILGSTSPAFRLYLTGLGTLKEMWDILRDRLDKAASINGRLALRRQFLSLTPVPGRPLGEFISHLHDIRFQLSASEQKIDDASFKDKLLSSLPSTFNNLVEIIYEKEADLSVEDVIRKIQQSEIARQKEVQSGNTSQVSGDALLSDAMIAGRQGRTQSFGRANSSYRTSPYESRRPFPFIGTCFRCKQRGHKANRCPEFQAIVQPTRVANPTRRLPFGNTSATGSCFACGERGHRSRECKYTALTQVQASRGRDALLAWRSSSSDGMASRDDPRHTGISQPAPDTSPKSL